KGGTLRLQVGAPLDRSMLETLEQRHGSMPQSIRRVFLEVSDGLHLNWSASRGRIGGVLSLPPAKTFSEEIAGWREQMSGVVAAPRLESVWFMDLVKIIELGNGDCFCVRTSTNGVYFQELARIANDDAALTSLDEDWDGFLTAWSRRCFQFPASLNWAAVIG